MCGGVVGGGLIIRFGTPIALPVAFAVMLAQESAVRAVHTRWLMRRVDARLLEILGPAAMAEAIEHLEVPRTVANWFRWWRAGLWPLASERRRWLRERIS